MSVASDMGIRPLGDQTFEGLHDAIIDTATWDAVQSKPACHATERDATKRRTAPNPLAGKLFDASGYRLTPSHANKKGRRYRYYISHHLIVGTSEDANSVGKGWRMKSNGWLR